VVWRDWQVPQLHHHDGLRSLFCVHRFLFCDHAGLVGGHWVCCSRQWCRSHKHPHERGMELQVCGDILLSDFVCWKVFEMLHSCPVWQVFPDHVLAAAVTSWRVCRLALVLHLPHYSGQRIREDRLNKKLEQQPFLAWR
jgi:hypothetical protein